jgi:hypothetical protein
MPAMLPEIVMYASVFLYLYGSAIQDYGLISYAFAGLFLAYAWSNDPKRKE